MTASIPSEIIESIIDVGGYTTADLQALALVSSAFTPATRRCLFRTVILGGFRRAVRFQTGQDPSVYRTDSCLVQYQELDGFLTERPYIAQRCIRSVRLRFEAGRAPTYDSETNKVVRRILSRLTNVEEYHLHLGRWNVYPEESREIVYSAIRQQTVSKIVIDSSDFDSFADLVPLLIHSPGLKSLALGDISINESEGQTVRLAHLPPLHLDYLGIENQLRDLVPALLDPAFPLTAERLTALRLRLPARPDACELINKLISRCSQSLLHLELEDNLLYRAVPNFFRLDAIPCLRTVDFRGFRSISFSSSLRWISKIFNDINTPLQIEEFCLSMMTHHKMLEETSVSETVLWGPFKQLDAVFSGEMLPLLRKTTFILTVRDHSENSNRDFRIKVMESFKRFINRPNSTLNVLVKLKAY